MAMDPRTSRIIYLEPFFRRDEHTTDLFPEHLVEGYGKWPRITDGGSWYRAAFSFWQIEGKIRWKVVRGGGRSVIEGFFGGFLKEGARISTGTFSIGSLGNLRSWLSSFAWLHNSLVEGYF